MKRIVRSTRVFLFLCLFLEQPSGRDTVWTRDAAIVSTSHQKYTYTEYKKDLKQLRKKYKGALSGQYHRSVGGRPESL